MVRVLTVACVIAVHTMPTINPPDSVPVGGAEMLLHFTGEVSFALTAFVLVYRYRDWLHAMPLWRGRFLLIGAFRLGTADQGGRPTDVRRRS